jgi:hypothetical protein
VLSVLLRMLSITDMGGPLDAARLPSRPASGNPGGRAGRRGPERGAVYQRLLRVSAVILLRV